MKPLPQKCLVDTNVPITANSALRPDSVPDELIDCVYECVEAIRHVINTRGLVLDAGDEIFDEYRRNLSLKGQPGIGDRFLKWVHDNRWALPEVDRVQIKKEGASYREFPSHAGIAQFDVSDRKFVAVAYAHPEKPPILQATDSKWWGWREDLEAAGITVKFLCEDYISKKYSKKMDP